MQTHRDAQVVDWIARLGAAGAEHVMSRFSLSRSVAYARLNSMVCDELLEHHAVLYARPGMYTATPAGLRWQGLESLGKFAVRPGGFEHAWQVAQAIVQIENGLSGWPVFSEREIRAVENNSGKLFASAKMGAVADRPALTVPISRSRVLVARSRRSRSSCRSSHPQGSLRSAAAGPRPPHRPRFLPRDTRSRQCRRACGTQRARNQPRTRPHDRGDTTAHPRTHDRLSIHQNVPPSTPTRTAFQANPKHTR